MNKLIASLAVGFFSVASFAANPSATSSPAATPAVPATAAKAESKAEVKAEAKAGKEKVHVAKKAEAAK